MQPCRRLPMVIRKEIHRHNKERRVSFNLDTKYKLFEINSLPCDLSYERTQIIDFNLTEEKNADHTVKKIKSDDMRAIKLYLLNLRVD